MQSTQVRTPVCILGIGFAPGFDFFNERQALRSVLGGIVLDFF